MFLLLAISHLTHHYLSCAYLLPHTVEKVKPAGASAKAGGCLLQPPTPIVRAANWPTLEVQKTTLEDLSAAEGGGEEYYEEEVAVADGAAAAAATDWEDDAFKDDMGAGDDDLDFGDDDGGMGWGDELDDLGDLGEPAAKEEVVDEMAGLKEVADDAAFKMPTAGRPPTACWVANSSHAADHMAAGAASSAEQLLNRQIAASDFSVLRETMMGTYISSMMSVPGKFLLSLVVLSSLTLISVIDPHRFFILFVLQVYRVCQVSIFRCFETTQWRIPAQRVCLVHH